MEDRYRPEPLAEAECPSRSGIGTRIQWKGCMIDFPTCKAFDFYGVGGDLNPTVYTTPSTARLPVPPPRQVQVKLYGLIRPCQGTEEGFLLPIKIMTFAPWLTPLCLIIPPAIGCLKCGSWICPHPDLPQRVEKGLCSAPFGRTARSLYNASGKG